MKLPCGGVPIGCCCANTCCCCCAAADCCCPCLPRIDSPLISISSSSTVSARGLEPSCAGKPEDPGKLLGTVFPAWTIDGSCKQTAWFCHSRFGTKDTKLKFKNNTAASFSYMISVYMHAHIKVTRHLCCKIRPFLHVSLKQKAWFCNAQFGTKAIKLKPKNITIKVTIIIFQWPSSLLQ